MNKNYKTQFILYSAAAMTIYWALLFFTGTKGQWINYIWQILLSVLSIAYGVLGLIAAKHWNWLKSNVGQGIFAIALGVIVWGIGQGIWTYYVIANPGEEAPTSRIIDLFYMTSIPLWIYGILRLSKATGARYGLKKPIAKISVVVTSMLLLAASYYLLVELARGGSSYFTDATPMDVFVDLGYAAGDAVNLILVVVIFGLSWKLLGGMFRRPILVILFSFVSIYLADTFYSYRHAQEIYYNGDIADLFYLLTIASFGIGLSMLDPITRKAAVQAKNGVPAPTDVQTAQPAPEQTAQTNPAPQLTEAPEQATAAPVQTPLPAEPTAAATTAPVAAPITPPATTLVSQQAPTDSPEVAAPAPESLQAAVQNEATAPLPQANTVISPTTAPESPTAQPQQNMQPPQSENQEAQ